MDRPDARANSNACRNFSQLLTRANEPELKSRAGSAYRIVKQRKTGAPDTIRTCDLCLRRVALYPAELRAQCLAVQRPNESNPLGVCCDIVKPVLGGVLSHLAWQSRTAST